MTDKELHTRIVDIFLKTKYKRSFPVACGCVGPKDGEPLCYCGMMDVVKEEDRFYKVKEVLDVEAQIVRFAVEELIPPKKITYYLRAPLDTKLLTYKKIMEAMWINDTSHDKVLNFRSMIRSNKFVLTDSQVMILKRDSWELFSQFVVQE